MLLNLPVFKDNYIWLYSNDLVNFIIVDPGEALPVIDFFEKNKNYQIEAILLTHHHDDHSGGLKELARYYPNIPIYSSFEGQIKGANQILSYHDQKVITKHFTIDVIATPGHTLGHFCYLIDNFLFSGDTLFSYGCGKVFEGTYEQMFESLNKLKNLPKETKLCAAHEYTINNLEFVKTITELKEAATIKQKQLIAKGKLTLPSLMEEELKLNPFLLATTVEQFKHLRDAKDIF